MNEEKNNLNEPSVETIGLNDSITLSPPLEPIEPPQPEALTPSVEEVPVSPALTEISLAPVVEPAIEPEKETFTASAVAQEPVAAPVLEPAVTMEPAIDSLSIDPSLANGLPDVNSVPAFEPAPEPKKKKGKGALGFIVVLLVLAGVAFGVYQVFMNNPHNVYKTIVSKIFTAAKNSADAGIDMNVPFTISGNVKVETNIEGMDALKDYSFDYLAGIDIPNNKIEGMFGLNEKDNELLQVFAYFTDKKMFINSEKLYDKLLYVQEADFDLSELIDSELIQDQLYLYDVAEKAIVNALTKDDFEKQSTSIIINGAETKVTENYVVITAQNIGTIMARVLNTFKNDSKALDVLAEMSQVSKEEIISLIDEMLAEEYSGEDQVRISFYTKSLTNKVVGYAIKANDVEILKAAFEDEKGKLEIYADMAVATFEKNGNVIDATISYAGQVLGTGKITTVSENECTIEVSAMGVTGSISISSKEVSDNLSTQSLIVDFSLPKSLTFKLTLTNQIELNKAVANIDTSNAKDINDLTEYEQEQIASKLEEILKPTAFYGMLEDISSGGIGGGLAADPACANAICDYCTSAYCECKYYDNTFTEQTVMCPNLNNTY